MHKVNTTAAMLLLSLTACTPAPISDAQLKLIVEQCAAKGYQHGLMLEVAPLRSAIAGACESSIIGVGSGGSYTVASLLCNLHETYTGRVSRPVTPLEVICIR